MHVRIQPTLGSLLPAVSDTTTGHKFCLCTLTWYSEAWAVPAPTQVRFLVVLEAAT